MARQSWEMVELGLVIATLEKSSVICSGLCWKEESTGCGRLWVPWEGPERCQSSPWEGLQGWLAPGGNEVREMF